MQCCERGWRSVVPPVVAATVFAACGVAEQIVPSPLGPSEFALSLGVAARPDQVPRDGRSTSSVSMTVRTLAGRPVEGLRLRVSAPVGRVTPEETATDEGGAAVVLYVAPPSSTVVPGNQVVISVMPVGHNYADATARTVSVRLTGPSNTGPPVPRFSFAPLAPRPGQAVRFDATATMDEDLPCGDACTYEWSFGGEQRASGHTVTHRFDTGRT